MKEITLFLGLVLALNHFSAWACTCRPVYSSDMRYSAMLVIRFYANCFALCKKQAKNVFSTSLHSASP